MALPTPPPYSNPIPNNPFYSIPVYTAQGPYYPMTVGPGLLVNPVTAVISSTGGGGGGVTSIVGTSGIGVTSPSGPTVTLTNTGVTSLSAGAGISLSGSTGNIQITNTGATGTVTTINTGTGLIGGPITGAGIISLDNTGVSAGTYANPASIDVNAQGQITSITAGNPILSVTGSPPISVTAGPNPVISVADATTSSKGVVILSDSVSSGSSADAATSAAVKTTYDVAIAAIPKTCITGVGTLITGLGAATPAPLPVGSNGQVLTACSACALGLYWATAASVPSATPTAEGIVFGCTENAGAFNTGLGAAVLGTPGASSAGNVALGASALAASNDAIGNVAVGAGSLCALTDGQLNLASGFTSLCNITTGCSNVALGANSGSNLTTECYNVILGSYSGVAAKNSQIYLSDGQGTLRFQINENSAISPDGSSFGSAGQVLCSGGSGSTWGWTTPVAAIPCACITAIGDLIAGTAANTPVSFPVGTDGQVLTACSTNPAGLCWVTPATTPTATETTFGTVYGFTNNSATGVNSNVSLGYGAGNTGCNNVAIGWNAGCGGSTNFSTWVGFSAGCKNVTGPGNTAVGWGAMCGVINGCDNVALGGAALFGAFSVAGTPIACNISIGTNSLYRSNGTSNIAIGWGAGCLMTAGNCNVLIGNCVQAPSSTGSCQLAIGYSASARWLCGDSTLAIRPGAGVVDCTGSCGTANMVLTSQGNAIQWKPVNSAIAAPNYGSYINTLPQTPNALSTGQPVDLGSLVAGNNFSLGGLLNSQIVAAVAGVYNLQFSLQLVSTSGGGGNVEVWLVRNGVQVSDSNTRFSVKNVNEAEFAALNYVVSLGAGDYLELYWATDNLNIQLDAPASTMGGPGVPSSIVTIVPVGA